MISVDIAPCNSLILVMDPSVGEVPDSMANGLVASTATCVAIGTLSEHDGTTHISMDDGALGPPSATPVFDGVLATPGRKLAVCSVLDEIILEMEVATDRTRVRAWANDPAEPNEIRISAVAFSSGLAP